MDPKAFHRKLAAILSADVAGYSRLMQDDEAATVTTLEVHKQVFSDLIKQHRGRVVDSPGDNLLAEFASVVDAVQCAVAVQKELQARNAELPENRRMLFRIGVNLGDVIEEDDRIYGDGVNIAARLESLADAGGICVSKTAFDQIETQAAAGLRVPRRADGQEHRPAGGGVSGSAGAEGDQGEGFEVQGSGCKAKKNDCRLGRRSVLAAVAWPLAGFPATCCSAACAARGKGRPQTDGAAPARAAVDRRAAFREPERGPKQQLLCDGITDNIINALSKVPRLFRHRPQFDLHLQGQSR